MLDLEILHCDLRLQVIDRAIKRHEISKKIRSKRIVINYKIEKEKLEIVRNDYVDLANKLRADVEKEIYKRKGKKFLVIVDFLSHSYYLDVVAKHYNLTEEEVFDILMDFSTSLCHRLKYIDFNEYFEI